MAEVFSYPTSYETLRTISGTNYKSTIGKGSDTANRTGNDYAKSSGSTAVIKYLFDFSGIPDNAVIESVTCTVKGHCENASKSQAEINLYAGSVPKSATASFTSTTDKVVTMAADTWTVDEIKNINLRFTIGYYGGLVSGATVTVVYRVGESVYLQISGACLEGNALYKKVNGSWIETPASEAFEDGTNYKLVT